MTIGMRSGLAAGTAASIVLAAVLAACSSTDTGTAPARTTPPAATAPAPATSPGTAAPAAPVTTPTDPAASRSEATPPAGIAPESTDTTSSMTEPATIATGLDAPWSIAFHGSTPLISERDSGRILELSADGSAREVATVPEVAAGGEGGLLGIAVRGDVLYAYQTTATGNRITRFPLSGEPGSLDLGAPEVLLDGIPAARIHNGGRLAFGPDGMLYATAGDAGDRAHAQDLGSLAGKILRMTPDGQVPSDNPFPRSYVYSYGHRNPQGLAWSDDGTLYASEFGQDTWDELNVIVPGGNYGWPEVEGIAGRDGFVDPVQQWAPADASPSGMAITDGTAYLANLRGQRLREVPLSDPATSTERFVGEFGRLRDIVVTPDGSLWLLTNNTDGRGRLSDGDDRVIAFPPH